MSNITVTPADLRALATQCETQARAVTQVRTAVTTKINATNWRSPAATRFESTWNTKYVKALNELTEALNELGKSARTMAGNYEDADASFKG